ncbi:DUF7940 domain-containing protein [Dickeya solani]|uniref:Holin n=1 Tax=Dickeya solani TaxID=1089444 RepID=A0ABU4EH82_9GAMM|nr:hypothetical protein [Dickeya solani]MCZ0823697.1 hypothetical protein [Dickeya solani]MDV6995604.1 hypothetical protein [Dickeya solani]MDV7002883.1 hypothetical protein [Dickeya solani]MDV7036659.1 hypothetical protein [Dickeya solani]MDV7043412.1 hypothetical protein [Dickeya solani]
MKMIDDWKSCWRWFSVHALALAGVIPAVWAELPDDMKASIPAGVMGLVTLAVALCGIVGRLVKQDSQQ